MSIASYVTGGIGPGSSIEFFILRGLGIGDEIVVPEVDDEYAGWASRDFYTPYWMGMGTTAEVEAIAREQTRRKRIQFGLVPPDAEKIIESLARKQSKRRSEQDEIKQFVELQEEFDAAALEWQDHFGGFLSQMREELTQMQKAKAQAAELRRQKSRREKAEIKAMAIAEIARRERRVLERQAAEELRLRNQRIAATMLLLSAA